MLLNRKNFVLDEIPHHLPILTPTSDYTLFWREQKRNCIEGYWSMGTWCPPQLYFYLNFWHIKVSEDIFTGNKTYSFPFFRELEWQKAYMYTEAAGFSGFADDEEFTCHRWAKDWTPEFFRKLPPGCYRKDGTVKTYVDAREYMKQFFPKSLGKPLYENEKKNIIDIEARECFGRGTRVRMFDGSTKAVENIREGDQLMGLDYTPREVQWTYSGMDQMFAIFQAEGEPYVVNSNHWLRLLQEDGHYLEITALDLAQKDPDFFYSHKGYKQDGSTSQIAITPIGEGEFFGFHLDKDHLVILEDGTVTKNTGKSYWASCCIAHNFLFDGYTDYDKFLADQARGKINPSETLVGSINTSYSDDLLKKVQDGLQFLPWEETNLKGEKVPAFFHKETTGSWKAGPNPIIAQYDRPVAGGWTKGGSKSKIHHRSFSDDLAGAGTRPSKIFIEEAGFQGNIKALLGALRDCTTTSGVKMGSIIMMGTGGEMDGATMEVQDVYYNPDEYDCVSFEDTWENSGKRIGFFACQPMADNEFLDKQTGKIDLEKAYQKAHIRRNELKKGKDKTAYNKELENKPLVPSEAFLVTGSNPFPVADLKEQLKWLETQNSASIAGVLGEMIIDPVTGKPDFVPDTEHNLRMPDWPIKRGDNDKKKGRDSETAGAVCIWRFPHPEAGYYWYSGGYDPTKFKEAPTSVSLDSFFLIERASLYNGGIDHIALEYTGRPESGDFQETLLKIFNYYDPNGAISLTCLYENNIRDFYSTCLQANELHYLALSPGIIQSRKKASENEYGLNSANDKVKGEILKYLKAWINKVVSTDKEGNKKLQLHHIYSKGLLKELIHYNEDGNFDRIIALALAVINAQQMYKIEVEKEEKQVEESPFSQWMNQKHFSHHRR